MAKRILITSGGTTEKIDEVRKITNTSTGRLGSLIAKSFYHTLPDSEIIYICSHRAIIPDIPLHVVKVNSVRELQEAMEHYLSTEKVDVVIHAMAVSDYTVRGLTTAAQITENIVQEIQNLNLEKIKEKSILTDVILKAINSEHIYLNNAKKISSQYEDLIISMNKTPKIIHRIKELQPAVILVGFKLLNQVSMKELIQTGTLLLDKNNCDFVLANDLTSIQNNSHIGYLIKEDTTYETYTTKKEIADGIVMNVITKLH